MRPGLREDGIRWTADLILYSIDLWARRYGRPPAANEWDRAGADHPSRQTVQRVFGTWNAAIEAAGFRPRQPGHHRVRGRVYRRDERGRFLPFPTQVPAAHAA
jgi:hypothetical protein